jgi:hypothetical protein
MGRAYNVIDADGHVLEPFFLWDEYMDPAYRKCGPKMVIDANGKERLWLQNKILGNALGLGRLFAPASPGAQPPPAPGLARRSMAPLGLDVCSGMGTGRTANGACSGKGGVGKAGRANTRSATRSMALVWHNAH